MWFGLLRIRSCHIARKLGDQGTWLPIRPAVTYVYTSSRPAAGDHLTQAIT
jgi:hypothetical protein